MRKCNQTMLNPILILFIFIFFLQIQTQSCSTAINSTKWEDAQVDSFREIARKKQEGMMNRVLPMMIIPFMLSTAIIPMMLMSLKFMVVKSAFIGKLAIILLLLNMLRSRTNGQGGVFTHNLQMKDMSMAHYGYSGDEEYGAYVN